MREVWDRIFCSLTLARWVALSGRLLPIGVSNYRRNDALNVVTWVLAGERKSATPSYEIKHQHPRID